MKVVISHEHRRLQTLERAYRIEVILYLGRNLGTVGYLILISRIKGCRSIISIGAVCISQREDLSGCRISILRRHTRDSIICLSDR